MIGIAYFEPPYEIKNMFFSRHAAIYEFVAIMSDSKVTIYEVCEDDGLGVEKTLWFEIDFLNNPDY